MATRRKSPEENSSTISFEDSLAELERIVETMEHEQLPLDELVSHYEKGSALLEHCESILQSAKKRIELITLRNEKIETADSAAAASPSSSAEPIDSDDIRLF